jgi:hypothetical protein
MNRNENETESFAGNFAASEQQRLFFEVPTGRSNIDHKDTDGEGAGPFGAAAINRLCTSPFIVLLHHAAPPHGSLTPADAPLIDAENLFRQSGPPLRALPRRPYSLGRFVFG